MQNRAKYLVITDFLLLKFKFHEVRYDLKIRSFRVWMTIMEFVKNRRKHDNELCHMTNCCPVITAISINFEKSVIVGHQK